MNNQVSHDIGDGDQWRGAGIRKKDRANALDSREAFRNWVVVARKTKTSFLSCPTFYLTSHPHSILNLYCYSSLLILTLIIFFFLYPAYFFFSTLIDPGYFIISLFTILLITILLFTAILSIFSCGSNAIIGSFLT